MAQSASRFVWYELMTTDPEAAAGFYAKVLGWGTAPFGEGGFYTMWLNGETPFGGLMKQPAETAGAPPAWLGYLGVEDVARAVEGAVAAGATQLVPPTDIPDAGRFAVLADPQGACIALHQSNTAGWTPPAGAPGFVSWNELMTSDSAAALAWYGGQFGWSAAGEHDLGGLVYRMFGVGDPQPAGGIFNRPPEMPVSAWLFYVNVADLDATVEAVKANGGTICNGPMEVPGGDRIAQCSDPQGAMFALHERAKA